MKMKIFATLLTVIMVATLAACTGSADNDAERNIVIGVSLPNIDEFHENLRIMYEEIVDGMDGVDIVIVNAGGSVSQQIADVETLIVQGVDVIIFRMLEMDAMPVPMQMIRDAEIYLVIDSVAVPAGQEFDARIAGVQLDHGRILGEFLQGLKDAGEITEANIGYIAGVATAAALDRRVGIYETLPTANFVAGGTEGFVLADGFNPIVAQEIVEAWIASGLIHEMNIIAAMNDELANAAIMALAGNFPDMIVLGIDGSAIGQQNIRNGTMHATTFQNLAVSARAVVDASLSLVRGEAIQFDYPENRLINPRHFFLMTIDNIDELLQ